jgi:hypothetical protein
MIRLLPIILLAAGFAATARSETPAAAPDRNATFSLVLRDFTWQEDFTPDLELEESGLLIGLRLAVDLPAGPAWRLRAQGEFYVGDVDYDGFLFNALGQVRPYTSTTRYAGVGGTLDAAYPLFTRSDWTLLPLAGLGAEYWLRRLDDGGESGYDEYWLTLFARLGARIEHTLQADALLFAEAAFILPFFNYEWAVDVPLADDTIELEPGEETGYRFEAGFHQGRFALTFFHERISFAESPPDSTGNFFQPASRRELTGLQAGLRF